jgi:hypothetical protein
MFCSRSAANAPSITPAVVRPGARDFPIPHQQLLERVADVVGAGRQLVPDRVGPGRGGTAPERAAGRPARRDRGSSPSRSRSERLSRGLPSRPSSSTALARAAGASSASRLRMPGRAAVPIAIRALAATARGTSPCTSVKSNGPAARRGRRRPRLRAAARRTSGSRSFRAWSSGTSASGLHMSPSRAACSARRWARGSAQATADAGDGAAGLEVLGDGLARLAAEGRRELGQDLGQGVLVAAVGAARRGPAPRPAARRCDGRARAAPRAAART